MGCRVLLFPLMLLCAALCFGQSRLDTARQALRDGDVARARELLESLTRADLADTGSVLLLADLHLRDQQPRRAESLLDRAIGVLPECGELYVWLGIALNMRGRYRKAEDAFLQANTLLGATDGDRAMLYVNLGLSVLNDGRPEESVSWFDKGIAFTPRNATAHGYKGMALYKMGDLRGAIQAYDRALEIDDTNAIVRYNRGVALSKDSQMGRACQDFHAACKLGNMNACKKVMMECKKQN